MAKVPSFQVSIQHGDIVGATIILRLGDDTIRSLKLESIAPNAGFVFKPTGEFRFFGYAEECEDIFLEDPQ